MKTTRMEGKKEARKEDANIGDRERERNRKLSAGERCGNERGAIRWDGRNRRHENQGNGEEGKMKENLCYS